MLRAALTHGMDVVLANKRPLAGRAASAEALLRAGARTRPPAAVRGDRGRRAAGHGHLRQAARDRRRGAVASRAASRARSGSCCADLERWTAVLRGAAGRRWTRATPSRIPREDLSGMDVARKALILGPPAGLHGRAEPSVGTSRWCRRGARGLPLKQFLAAPAELGRRTWPQRVSGGAAEGAGAALRRHGDAATAAGRAAGRRPSTVRSPPSRAPTTRSCSPPRATGATRW